MIRVAIAVTVESVAIDRKLMRQVVRTVLAAQGVDQADLSIAFVDNSTIHTLNQRYLNHAEPTDVLSFPLSEANARVLAGELVIGAEIAKLQADSRGHDIAAELALYVIHGLLHLCGYEDATPAAAREMHSCERQYLLQMGFPDITPRE